MGKDDVLKLVGGYGSHKDEYGVYHENNSSREVLCRVKSITRSEFFGNGRTDMNPEYEFEVFEGDYRGEELCIYNDRMYSIYRTFNPAGEDYIELYAARRGGTDSGQKTSQGR